VTPAGPGWPPYARPMANRWGTRIGLTMAVLVGAVTIALAATPASACSFAFPGDVTIEGRPEAGGALVLGGSGFVSIDGEVSAACGGDYDFVPAAPLTLVVDFTTLSGPRSTALVAPVTGPRIPNADWKAGDEDAYVIDVSTPIPADATAVTVHAEGWFGEPVTATVSGAVATTVPVTPTTPASAAPADAVAGSPRFTG